MRSMLLIAAAGLAGLVTATSPARAQYYGGWGYYRPYYPVPYGYYPRPYYVPPPIYAAPYPRLSRPRMIVRPRRHGTWRPHRVTHRRLVNPLLGPLPGSASFRRY